jgi:Domain of unknown function (DUF4149)
MKFFSDIRLLLLAIWIGAAVFFIAVAQSAFAVLPSRELAGNVVNRTLAILNYSGVAISIILLLTSMVASARVNKMWLWVERLLLVLLTAACAVGQFVIGFWLSSIRAQFGKPVDEVAVDDPLRIQFNSLHEYSVWVLFAGMIAAAIAFFIIANRRYAATKTADPGVYDFQKEFKI